MRVLIHVDRLGEVQQSHVVEESLVVEVGVNDDPVNRDFEVREVGVVLALADVVLAQADFEAPGGGGRRGEWELMVVVLAMRAERKEGGDGGTVRGDYGCGDKGGEEGRRRWRNRGRRGVNSERELGL